MKSSPDRVYQYTFASIYPLYLAKITRKGRSQEELDTVLTWLTGYDQQSLQQQIAAASTLEQFFRDAPQMNPQADNIKGLICGVRVEDIQEPLMQKIRWMDKLVDELAKGKAMGKILREAS